MQRSSGIAGRTDVGSVYQRVSDGRWVAAMSHGPRGAVKRIVRYADTEDEAWQLLEDMGGVPLTPSERFWSHVSRGEGCWEWQRFRHRGYGRYGGPDGHRWVASRFAYQDAVGPIPARMRVLHRCDNPPCVRPDHLFLGTAAENTADMVRKGRASWQKNPVATDVTVSDPATEA